MYKLVLNEDTMDGISIESFSENYSSKYGTRSFNANGINALSAVSPLDILQNAVTEGLVKISVLDPDNEVIWTSTKYKDVENSSISVSTGANGDMNFSVSFAI